MTTYQWATIRNHLNQTFGRTPTPSQEQRIIDVFEHQPALVDQLATEVETAYQRGTSHSPWGLLALKAEQLTTGRNPTVDDTSERDTAVRKTEQWIRTASLYLDRQSELEDELFGDRGRLRHWNNDNELRAQLVELWQQQQPRGEQAEHQADEYQQKAGADYLQHHPANRPAATENP